MLLERLFLHSKCCEAASVVVERRGVPYRTHVQIEPGTRTRARRDAVQVAACVEGQGPTATSVRAASSDIVASGPMGRRVVEVASFVAHACGTLQ